jgi:hypothetical protein
MVYEANKLQNRISIHDQLLMQAFDFLTTLANSIFIGRKFLAVESNLGASYLANIHAAKFKMDYITSYHWAWRPISTKKVGVTDVGLNNFIKRTGGTYALIFVQSGVQSGHHLMYIKSEP